MIASSVAVSVARRAASSIAVVGATVQNKYIQFDGSNDYATIPSVTHSTAAGTLMVRCKLDVATPPDYVKSALVEWTSVTSFHYPFQTGDIYCAIFRNTRVDAFAPSGLVDRTGWHWVIIRDDAANNWQFLQSLDDGVLISVTTATHEAWDVSADFRFIGENVIENKFDGAIDRFLIGDSRWSDAQIQAVIAGGNGPEDTLVRYEFNSLAGGVFSDESGNGHDAVISGAPTLEVV